MRRAYLLNGVGVGVDRHIGLGEIFELGEVNAHGMCASATNIK